MVRTGGRTGSKLEKFETENSSTELGVELLSELHARLAPFRPVLTRYNSVFSEISGVGFVTEQGTHW